MPIYGGLGTIEEVTSWARLIVQAIRSGGVTQPVSIGDGAWGIEVSGDDNGYSLRALAPLVDFLGPHVYGGSDDPVRQSMAAAIACELSRRFWRPCRARGVRAQFGICLRRQRRSLLPPSAAHNPNGRRRRLAGAGTIVTTTT